MFTLRLLFDVDFQRLAVYWTLYISPRRISIVPEIMISPTDNGFSDADIQGLKLAFSQSCSTANLATTSSAWSGIVSESANYRTGLQSHKNTGCLDRRNPTGSMWTVPAVDVKGKGVARSLDWHLATMASNDWEREGSYIICSPGTTLTTLFLPLPHSVFRILTVTEITFKLLESLPRSVLASLQRRMTPLLQLDIVAVSLTCICDKQP